MRRLAHFVAASLAVVTFSGCKLVGGYLFPAWADSVTNVTCAPSGSSRPAFRVFVADPYGKALPGAQVQIVPDSPAGSPLPVLVTSAEGLVILPANPVRYRAVVSLAGFHSVIAGVSLGQGQECSVKAFLEVHMSSDAAVVS